jgi:sulfite exporter TauE/SafE
VLEWPLIAAGLAAGLAASPHCVVMCGAPCAALTSGGRRSGVAFHVARLLSYMAGGALAAQSVATLGAWSQAAPALRPLWTALHLAFLALGLWWLASGRPLAWMARSNAVPVRIVGARARPLRAGVAGLAWVAWPCGALQAALLLSALASSAPAGALVMAAFASASMPALAAAPWAWRRWRAAGGATLAPERMAALGYRVTGAGLVLASGWALGHGIWQRVAAWCGI